MNGFPAGATALTATLEDLESAHLAIASRDTRAAPPEFIAGAPGAGPATTGPDQATLTRASQSTDWLFHTHDDSGTRFSPLQEVNAATAARLAPACLFQVGERDNLQTGPIIYNGTMWVERNPGAPMIVVFALPGNPRVDRTEYWRRITPSWAAIRWFV